MQNEPELKCNQNLRLPVNMVEKLRAVAREDRRTISDAAVFLIERGLEQREREHAKT